MAFEQNQQDQFNMNNGIDQVKQFQAELDKATASIGAAELAAEEEQLGIKLKNLSKLQQTKLMQLGQLLELEEKGIQELAKLKLSLSNRQFAVRKKEIQKEFQLYKAAAEELFKAESKHKFSKQNSASKKTSSATDDLKTSAKKKPADVAIQKASRKVQGATYDVDKTRQEITDAISSLRYAVDEAVSASQKETESSAVQTRTPIDTTNNSEPVTEVKASAQKEQQYSDNHGNMEKADLGHKEFSDVATKFEKLRGAIEKQSTSILAALNTTTAEGGKNTTQASVDLAGELLDSFEKAEDAVRKLREFNENKILNRQLIQLSEGQKLREGHEAAIFTNIAAKIAADAKAEDIEANRRKYLNDAAHKLSIGHITKQNSLKLDAINEEAKAKDLVRKKEQYIVEARQALELEHARERNKLAEDIIKAEEKRNDLLHNKKLYDQEEEDRLSKALIDDQNKLTEDFYKTQKSIAFTQAHEDELRAIEHQKLINQHATDYDKYLKDILAADEKAKDLEHNHVEYLNKELDNLERGHKEQQNKLTQDIINAEAKGIDLRLNKEQYITEEKARLDEEFAEKNNKLTEDAFKRKAQLDYIEEHRKELIDQNLEELRSQHADEEVQRRKDHIKALARSIQLEEDRAILLEDAKKKLAEEHTNKQNDLKQGAIDNDAKFADIQDNKDQYILEARMAHENEFYAERNRRLEESFAIEQGILWDKEHIAEVMAEEVHKKQIGFAKEYGEYQRKAGKYAVDKEKFEKDKARKDRDAAKKEAVGGITDGLKKFGTGEFSMTDIKKSYSEYMGQRTAELEEAGLDESSAKVSAQFELLAAAAGNLMDALDADVRKIAEMQGFVDTRLQGSKINEQKGQSYWKQLLKDAKSIAGASPFIKQEKLVDNIRALVDKGISFDVKQRAFLMTMQEKVANTFNVADGTLLRLIRIQQEDTTAGRLGMESALNSFLNSMYETSEYLENVASSVRTSLEEMQALMEGAAGTEVEYQVQKWMGSLYSVGMSDSAVQGIAQAFGQIASGDVSGLTGNGTGNLLIMAANEAGKSIADILQSGLDAKETNELMQAMVNYLAEIAETSSDSRVVQQQLANVYGIRASDLRAATNLASSVKDVAKYNLTYDSMLSQLEAMMNTLSDRTSISEGMTNMWDNVMYSMASTQASNPILYMLPKMANLLKDVTGGEGGGIALPFLNVMGFGVDLNTTVADLMLVAAMSGTALGALGPAITGLVDLATGGKGMLSRAGIETSGKNKIPILARGSATPFQNIGGSSISESGYVGNSSGDDIKNATMQDAEDSKKKQMVEAKDEESADDVVIKSQQAIIDIYNLLEEVAHGSQSLRVRVISNSNAIGAGGGGSSGGGSPIGESSNNGTTGAGISNSADNGNWVLAF